MTEKAREARARRKLARQGYTLQKARKADAWGIGWGPYAIIQTYCNTVETYGLNLEAVEEWAASP